jgi:5-methylthioadenosine/S-adenosylhomocysteine deaminase
MQHIDTLIYAGYIIPVEPENKVYTNHACAIDDGKIVAIIPSEEAVSKFSARLTYRLPHHILMPGLINTHSHTAMNLLRGYADDLHLMEWLTKRIWPIEQKCMSAEFVHDGSSLAIAEMLSSGVTCFNDMYFYPEITAQVAEVAGIRAVIGLIVIDFPSAWANNADECLAKAESIYADFKGHSLIKTALAPHAPYSVSDEAFICTAEMSAKYNLKIHTHLHETNDEITQSKEKYGCRPIERFKKLGLLNENLIAVHMTQLNDDEIVELEKNCVNVVHCPESNLKLASGLCRTNDLIKSNINVALGTDSVASNNDLDMFGEMRNAALLAKLASNDATAMPAYQALNMATINAAKVLGINDITGSLVAGKAADIIAIDTNNIESQPIYNPISHIIYTANRSHVTDVWIAGKHLLKSKMLTSLNVNELQVKAHYWKNKIIA